MIPSIGALVGALYSYPDRGLLVAALLLLGWQLRQMLAFDRALRDNDFEGLRYGEGFWSQIYAHFSQLRQRTRSHKKRYRQVLKEIRKSTNAMPDGAIILNESFEIVTCNAAAKKLAGFRPRQDRGHRVDNILRDPAFGEYLKSGNFRKSVQIRSPLHTDHWLACRVVPYGAEQRLLLLQDITERHRLTMLRREFVANASHELRSPLTVITGYLDALGEDGSLEPVWKGPVEEMRRQTERMRGIVQDLLELSRLEAQAGEAEKDPVDVAGMLALIRKDVMARPTRPATIELRLDSQDRLLGSETELHSIFANLVTNAVKYTPADGRVDIRWWSDPKGGHVEVKDTGIGIPSEHLPRLTERFYRVDAGRSRKLGGSGLGLAIVKHALQRHGGRLEVQSAEGHGSTFTCHFPIARVEPRPPD